MLTVVRRRCDSLRSADDGVTLAETLVAMAVTTLVGTIALSFFVWTGRSTSDAAANSLTTDGARLGVSAMASTLRYADSPTSQVGSTAFRVVGPLSRTTISFFTNVNGNRAGSAVRALPTRVVYALSGTTVTEARYQPLAGATASSGSWSANYPTTPTSSRTVLRGVAALQFDYTTFDSSAGVLVPVTDANLSTAANAVVAVTVTVTTVATSGRPAQTVTATASLTGSTT